jgi:hypothetical protein
MSLSLKIEPRTELCFQSGIFTVEEHECKSSI